jgi:putative ABC transport system permease protein
MASQGESMGFNTDEIVIVPVASAHMLFNTTGLFRILVEAKSRDAIEQAKKDAETILFARHNGVRDVTVITQDAVLATFDRILRALTLAVGGIAAISLSVAGILIMNVMLIAVSQRVQEIGLLKALGAPAAQIRNLFFTEAVLLSSIGTLPHPAGRHALVGDTGSHRHLARHRRLIQRMARTSRRPSGSGNGTGGEITCCFPT